MSTLRIRAPLYGPWCSHAVQQRHTTRMHHSNFSREPGPKSHLLPGAIHAESLSLARPSPRVRQPWVRQWRAFFLQELYLHFGCAHGAGSFGHDKLSHALVHPCFLPCTRTTGPIMSRPSASTQAMRSRSEQRWPACASVWESKGAHKVFPTFPRGQSPGPGIA